MGLYTRFAVWVGDKPWFRPIARSVIPPIDRLLLRVAGWRATPWPTLLLTTTGRRSGRTHDAPLYFVRHGEAPAVIATNYGRAEPQWSRNLRHDPACLIKIGHHTATHRARQASAEEWRLLFERFASFYPSYRAYRERAHRDIPIWVLEHEPAGQ